MVQTLPSAGQTEYTLWSNRKAYKNVLLSVCIFILAMEFAERLSYYGINQGLKNFMKKLGWTQVSSNSIKSTWTSLCYLSPLLGAWIADEKWGRYKTIMVFGVWYLIGDFLVAFAAHPDLVEGSPGTANGLFMLGLFGGIAIGTGAIKSNVVTYGADQFDPNDEAQVEQRQSFFSWFYWCINIGATFSYGYLTTLSANGHGAITPRMGYFATYLLCAIVMGLALVFFFFGRSRYVNVPPSESALTKLVTVISRNSEKTWGGRAIIIGFVVFVLSFLINTIAAFITDSSAATGDALSISAAALAIVGIALWIYYGMNNDYMDVSKSSHGGDIDDQTVEEIKSVIRVLPFAAFMVMWHCVYDQIDANFQSVTQQCDLRLHDTFESTQVPGAMLGVFGTISIIVVIPILENIIYPAYRMCAKKDPSPFGKVLAGLIVATLTMVWAGIFEKIRRNAYPIINTDICPDVDRSSDIPAECFVLDNGGHQPMNAISWSYAIPMYLMVGTAECLINVTAFDVFYANVPEYLKSTCQAINLFMIAMGANVTSIFTLVFADYIPDDLNRGNLEYMFFGITVASTLNIVLYVFVMWKMQFAMDSSQNMKVEDTTLLEKNNIIDPRMSERSMQSRDSVLKVH